MATTDSSCLAGRRAARDARCDERTVRRVGSDERTVCWTGSRHARSGTARLDTRAVFAVGALCCLTLAASGCITTMRARTVAIAPDGTSMRSTDSSLSFAVRTGELVPTPQERVTAWNWQCVGRATTYETEAANHGDDIIYVTIEHAGLPAGETLYGALLLCEVVDTAPSTYREIYLVQIPQEYVDGTTDGRRAFITEFYPGVPRAVNGTGQARGWLLWIQRTPFR